MASLLRTLGLGRRERPATVPTDEVVPVHFFDDTGPYRQFALHWTLRFNDVLDADMLNDSLVRLVHMGDWRKLGGRLRMNAAGKLELHIPATFDAARPAVNYTHVSHGEVPIASHPVASRLPTTPPTTSPTDGAPSQPGAIFPGLDAFFPVVLGLNTPRKLEDYLAADVPQLALHVVTFADATLVTLSWLHTCMDGTGRAALLDSWCRVLAGAAEQDVPKMLGLREDPLEGFAEAAAAADDGATATNNAHAGDGAQQPPKPREEFVLARTELKGLAMLWFVVQYVAYIIWRPVMTARTAFVPGETMRRLKSRATADLAAARDGGERVGVVGPPAPLPAFVSEGDVLTAWFARCMVLAHGESTATTPRPPPSTGTRRQRGRLILVMNQLSIAARLPARFAAGAAYLQNVAVGVTALVPARAVAADAALGVTAGAVRNSIASQGTAAQIEAQMAIHRRAIRASGGNPTLFGESDALLISITNWTKMGFMQRRRAGGGGEEAGGFRGAVDFGPAVLKVGTPLVGKDGKPRANAPGQPENSLAHVWNARDIALVLGKDAAGNYWFTGFFTPRMWASIERELKELAKLN